MIVLLAIMFAGFFAVSCSSPENDKEDTSEQVTPSPSESSSPESAEAAEDNGKGIGPVTSVDIPKNIDHQMATEGHALFETKCTACHNPTSEKKVGPGLKGVSQRRKPEWIMNMILNPSEMTQKDPTAHELLGTYMAQMANQSLTQEEARKVYEFFRENDTK